MKKQIIINKGIIKELTKEETILQFEPLVMKLSKKYSNKNKWKEEELYQEAMIAVMRAYDSYDAIGTISFYQYVKKVIERQFYRLWNNDKSKDIAISSLNIMLKSEKNEEEYINIIEDKSVDVEADAMNRLIHIDIQKIFDNLRSDYKEIVTLLYEQGLSQSDVSKRLGVSRQSVNAKMKKIKDIIREQVELIKNPELDFVHI